MTTAQKEQYLHSISIDPDVITQTVVTKIIPDNEIIIIPPSNPLPLPLETQIKQNTQEVKYFINKLSDKNKNRVIWGLLITSVVLVVILILK